MKTKISLNILDIDALTSVLEIARTASYAVEVNRLIKLAVLSSAPQELMCDHYKRLLVTTYRGSVDDSPEGDMHALVADWAAVGADMHKALGKINLEPDVIDHGLEKKWKDLVRTGMKTTNGIEKSAATR
ncbi:hypothetical protein CCL15_12675 [Pseudomonas syringae]|uniref:hypothetical protein n=1 Tax=Pseudomonas syringae TaxID=317 RepID=UPI000BDC69BF|nr:hypothetical protein [Pseudomonas syringae]PBP71104.1 hypothetical protein CCL15_12675 [Pseudomonas syringae]